MSDMLRITLKLGKLTRRVVLTAPPFPKVGDEVTIKGEGAAWTVAKAQKTSGLVIGRNVQMGKAKVKR